MTRPENDAQNLLTPALRTEDSWRRLRLEDKEAIWAFMQEISPNLTPEWIIFWTPQVRTNMAASTEARLALSAGGDGNDWFETTCDLKAADGTPIPFERAVEAIANGEEHVRLASGTVGAPRLNVSRPCCARSKPLRQPLPVQSLPCCGHGGYHLAVLVRPPAKLAFPARPAPASGNRAGTSAAGRAWTRYPRLPARGHPLAGGSGNLRLPRHPGR